MNHTVLYANNRKISLYLWENQSYSRPVAIVQIVHGFFDHASRYDEFAQFLVRHGMVVVAHDLNGHGYTSSNIFSPEVNTATITTSSLSSTNSYSESGKSSSYYPSGYDLKQHHNSYNPPSYTPNDDSILNNNKLKNKSSNLSKEEQISLDNHDSMKIPMPTPAPDYYPPETTTMPSSVPNTSHAGYSNYNSMEPNDINNHPNDEELPPYSKFIHHLGFEEGNMFQNDILDILAVSSYCRERYIHTPLIFLGIGYGSYLAQCFIEHNKYRRSHKEFSRHSNYYYQNQYHQHHYDRHHHNGRNSSSKRKGKKHKKEHKEDDTLVQRHSLIDPTIDGFILCGTNYMKGLLLRTNEFYADFLYYTKGKNYRSNFLFPSLFQTYKLQMEHDLLNSDSDSDSDSDSNSHTGSYIDSPNAEPHSREQYSVPRVTFSPSEINKYKPINQWFSRNYQELIKAQQDPLCNFCYSVNFYRSLLNSSKKLYKKSKAKAINTKIPILILAGDHDPLGNYSKGPVRLYNFYKDYNVQNVKLFIYENARHAILFENNKVEIYHDILKWTNDNVLLNY